MGKGTRRLSRLEPTYSQSPLAACTRCNVARTGRRPATAADLRQRYRIAACRPTRLALLLFLALVLLAGLASPQTQTQNYYQVTFQQASLNALNTSAGPYCTAQSTTTTSAPFYYGLVVPATQVVKNDQGWVPFTISAPYLGSSITSSLNQNGVATTVAQWAVYPGEFPPNTIDSGNFQVVETIDLNTGAYAANYTGNYVDEVDGCTGVLYVDETDPATGLAYPGPQNVSFSSSVTGVVGVVLGPGPAPSLLISVSNPYSCSIAPADCTTIPGTSTIEGAPAWGLAADGRSAALITINSNDVSDPVQITLSASGFSGALGSLGQYDPNFLNESSEAILGNTSVMVYPDPSCENQDNCNFLALLWAPDGLSGSAVSQPVQLTLTVTQGMSAPLQWTVELLPPPLVLVHGLWSSAKTTWPDFEQWLEINYPYSNWIFPADYGQGVNNYSYLSFSDPRIQNILENAIADALECANVGTSVLGIGVSPCTSPGGVVARTVDVVAHSMGGLVTRYFMDNINNPPHPFPFPYILPNPMHQLITIGTPHLGSPLATVLEQEPSPVFQLNWEGALIAGICSNQKPPISPCDLKNFFAQHLNQRVDTGVQSLVPMTAPLDTLSDAFDYKSIAGIAPQGGSLPCPIAFVAGSRTEFELDVLTCGFTGQTIESIFQESNDTIVGYDSQLGPSPINLKTEYNVVHAPVDAGDKKIAETENQAVWNQVAAWLMTGSGGLPAGSSHSKPNPAPKAPHALGGATGSPPPVLDLTGYTEVSASNVSFSPASGSVLTINSATDITATSSTKTVTEILLFQTVSDPSDAGLLYSTQSPFTIIFVPTRMGSTSFVAFAVFSDKTYAVTTLDYTFQVSGNPLALNLVNGPAAALAVGSSAGVDAQASFANGHVDVSQAASYSVRSGSTNVISVSSAGLVTANGTGSDWLDVSYNGLTASTQITVGSCTYAVSPGNQLANVSGGAASIQITTQSGCAWTADDGGSPWLTFTNASGAGSGTVTLTATANTTGATRVALIKAAGQRAAITQPATSCMYTVNGTPISAPAAGLSGSLPVTTSCPIVVSTSATWLSVTPLASSIDYFVAPNQSMSQRAATMTIGTQTIVVTQGAFGGPLSTVAPTSLTFGGQNVGTTSPSQPVTLKNTGEASLSITGIVATANFGETDNCMGSVAAGATCTINVTFSPAATGALSGTLTITDNSGGLSNTTQEVALAGVGVKFTTLVNFDTTNGSQPNATLVQGADGYLYGITSEGGTIDQFCPHGCGTLFKMSPVGTLSTLYSFCSQSNFQNPCTDGGGPSGLVLGTDGSFYGTTAYGGIYSTYNGGYGAHGTVFKITPGGVLTTLHSFSGTDGWPQFPAALLAQAGDGNFYGTTIWGGANESCNFGNGCGTVFRIAPGGAFTSLYSFCSQSNCADGFNPSGTLVQAADGNLYGTTQLGGAYPTGCGGTEGCGTVFKITPGGTLTTIHSFSGADGVSPLAGLVQAADGNLYGTTLDGGAHGNGTVFEIMTGGAFALLHSFCSQSGCTDGREPYGGLVQASDASLYGTTFFTAFKISAAATLTTLYNGSQLVGSYIPSGGLMQATDGSFYGLTSFGGGSECYEGCGTIFRLDVGLGPFVKTIAPSGAAGMPVSILGNNLSGTTRVAFSGTAATFKVVSDTQINATVPAGTTTDLIQVTTPSGTLTSDVPFAVKVPTPTFSKAAGTYCSAQAVAISEAEKGAAIYYTTDGTTPTTESTEYTKPVNVNSSETLQAIATGVGYPISSVATASYTITAPVLDPLPPSLAFGVQTIGTTSSPQPITVSNAGSAAVSISGITSSAEFSQTNTCGSRLAGSGSCTVSVSFAPTAIGPQKGTISIADSAPCSPQTAIVTGVGTAVSLSASSLNFGGESVGSSSNPQTVTITNKAGSTIHLWQIAITGTDKSDFSETTTCGSTLAASASCSVSVRFKPNAKGARSASLLFSDDGGGSPQVVTLSGTGE